MSALEPATIANRRWRQLAEMAPQAIGSAAHVPSPCQSVCIMHPQTAWCEGCMRTLDEIAAWSRMDAASKRQVWAMLPERLAQRIALDNEAP